VCAEDFNRCLTYVKMLAAAPAITKIGKANVQPEPLLLLDEEKYTNSGPLTEKLQARLC